LIDEIMTHRRIELWGEGFRYYDLKRLAQPLDRTGANHSTQATGGLFELAADDPRWTFLIPQSEVDANPNINTN